MSGIVRRFLEGVGGKRRPDISTETIYREFQESLNLIEDFDQIALNLLGTIREAVPVEKLAFFVYDSEMGQFRAISSSGAEPSRLNTLAISPHDRLAKWLKVNKTYLHIRNQPSVFGFLKEEERVLFERQGFEVCFPLLSMNRLIGMLCVGSRKEGEAMTGEDVAFIESLTPQAGIALENALLYREQRERYRRMLRADRLATIGELAAGAAHEIRNPLTSIKSSIQYLETKSPRAAERKLLRTALQETARIDEILSALLSFSRPSAVENVRHDLIAILKESLALVVYQAKSLKVKISTQFPSSPLAVRGDKSQLKQLFLNVYLNALQAMPEGGEMKVEALPPDGQKIVVRIADTGKGISPADIERIFDPFFTTKKGGTGLGLSICYGIIKSHKGDIEVRSRPEEGTEVLIAFPLY